MNSHIRSVVLQKLKRSLQHFRIEDVLITNDTIDLCEVKNNRFSHWRMFPSSKEVAKIIIMLITKNKKNKKKS